MNDSGSTSEVQKARYFLSRHHRGARDYLLREIDELGHGSEASKLVASLCVALITTSVSYMECRINEFWSGVLEDDRDSWSLTEPQKEKFRLIAETVDWKRKLSVLDKFQTALKILDLSQFGRGEEPFQSVQSLVDLRNELVHNVPQDIDLIDANRISKTPRLESRLRILAEACPSKVLQKVFPDNVLHGTTAHWAVDCSQSFVDNFLTLAGLEKKQFVMSIRG